MFGYDQSDFSPVDTVHSLVYNDGHQVAHDDTVNQAVHVFRNEDSSQKYDECVHGECNIADRQMRIQYPDGHRNEVRATGGRVPHVDHGVAQSGKDTTADGCQKPVTGVDRKQGRNSIDNK